MRARTRPAAFLWKFKSLILGCYDSARLSVLCEEYHDGKQNSLTEAKKLFTNRYKGSDTFDSVCGVLYINNTMISKNTLLSSYSQETGHFLCFTFSVSSASFSTYDSLNSDAFFSEKLLRRLGQFLHKTFEGRSRSIRSFSFNKNIFCQKQLECGVRACCNMTLFLIFGTEGVKSHTFQEKTYLQSILNFKLWLLYIIYTQNTIVLSK